MGLNEVGMAIDRRMTGRDRTTENDPESGNERER
jgi:hypothetical protein